MEPRRFAAIAICCALGALGILQISGNGGLIGWLLGAFLLLGARFYLRPAPGELALVAKCVAALLGFVALLVAVLFVSWESAEVVVLRYTNDRGDRAERRLWVIDLEERPSVVMGSGKRRVGEMQANPQVELVRAGQAECRMAVVVSGSTATRDQARVAERLFEEKYGVRLYATRALRFVMGAPPGEEPVLIRLEPCEEKP